MCRYGGEEFAIVLPDTDLTAATAVAERIREAVAEAPFLIIGGKHKINMTISIGIAGLRLMGGDTAEALLHERMQHFMKPRKQAGIASFFPPPD